jgi:hypothetical protein
MPRLIALYSPMPRSGKTTLAEALVEQGFVRIPFAAPLKSALHAILLSAGASPPTASALLNGPAKDQPTPYFAGRSPRHALQTLGTEWGRDLISPDFWLSTWRTQVLAQLTRGISVVTDDLRFPNEANTVLDLDGTTIHIDRPAIQPAPPHPSEGNLSHWHFDLRLTNNHDTPSRWASHGTTSIRALTSTRLADSLACGHEPYDLN